MSPLLELNFTFLPIFLPTHLPLHPLLFLLPHAQLLPYPASCSYFLPHPVYFSSSILILPPSPSTFLLRRLQLEPYVFLAIVGSVLEQPVSRLWALLLFPFFLPLILPFFSRFFPLLESEFLFEFVLFFSLVVLSLDPRPRCHVVLRL